MTSQGRLAESTLRSRCRRARRAGRSDRIDPLRRDVIVGCVTQAGEQAFAFGASWFSLRLPDSVPAVTSTAMRVIATGASFRPHGVMSGTRIFVIPRVRIS